MNDGAKRNGLIAALLLSAFWFSPALAQSTALTAINARLTSLQTLVNSHAAAGDLDYTQLLPYFDPNFLHDGGGPVYAAQTFADALRGASISSIAANQIVSSSTDAAGNSNAITTGTLDASSPSQGAMSLSWSPDLTKDAPPLSWFYQPAGANWGLYGDHQPAKLQLQAITENRQSDPSCQSCSGTFYYVWFQAKAPQGSVGSVSVNGPSYANVPLVFNGTNTEMLQASPPPAAPVTYTFDQYALMNPNGIPSLPAPGTAYTFSIAPTGGQAVSVQKTVQQTTTETVAVTNPTDHLLASANLGGTLTVNWTTPTSFTVRSIDVNLNTNSAAGNCGGGTFMSVTLPPGSTSYTFSPMPTTCLGSPIADNVTQGGYPVQIMVEFFGTKGEDTRAWYSMGQPGCNGNSPPGTPFASSVSGSAIQLQWNRACMPTTVANYGVYRGTSASGPFNLLGQTDLNTRTYTDTTVSAGTTYYYYITSTDNSGTDPVLQSGQFVVTASSSTGTTTTTSTTTTSSTSTTVGSTTTTTLAANSISLIPGWNLLGNGMSNAIAVTSALGDATKVSTVWKWVASSSTWAFYTPTLADGGAAYAASKGYTPLSTINGGEGFWVNAKSNFSIQLAGNPVPTSSFADGLTSNALPSGWSLIAIGDNLTPTAFANGISVSPPAAGTSVATTLTSLWAWDPSLSGWYFFAPSLVNGGTQASYIASKSYLDFGGRTLAPGAGFWVNKP